MRHAQGRSLAGVVLFLVLATTARGQSVHVVAGDGSGGFLQLQHAVNAAASGDVILVRPYTQRYDATVISGKALTIVGDGDVRPGLKRVRITGLPAGKVVSLRFLDIEGDHEVIFPVGAVNYDGVSLIANGGCVWLEDLLLAGDDGLNSSGTDALNGKAGLASVSSPCVVLVRSQLHGGDGALSTGGSPNPGGKGARSLQSSIATWNSTFLGGAGAIGINSHAGAQGGAGFEINRSTVFLSGSALTGGATGTASVPSPDPTASAAVLIDAATVQHLATTFQAGAGNAPPGAPVSSAGVPSTFDDLNDDSRQITISAAVRELAPAAVTYSGQPGDLVLLAISLESNGLLVTKFKGVLHLGAFTSSLFLGVADANGALDLSFIGPLLPPGIDAVTGYAQPVVAETGGSLRLGAPSSILLLDGSIPPP
jgi:hypothetical protein